MKKIIVSFCLAFWAITCVSYGQGVGINSTGNLPDPSAALDVSGVSKGVLSNRMSTTERNAIVSPAEGLQVYNTTSKCFEFYNGTSWLKSGAGETIKLRSEVVSNCNR